MPDTNILSPESFARDWDPFARIKASEIAALRAVIAAKEACLAVLKANPWAYDFINTASHNDHVLEDEAVLDQIKGALDEALIAEAAQ